MFFWHIYIDIYYLIFIKVETCNSKWGLGQTFCVFVSLILFTTDDQTSYQAETFVFSPGIRTPVIGRNLQMTKPLSHEGGEITVIFFIILNTLYIRSSILFILTDLLTYNWNISTSIVYHVLPVVLDELVTSLAAFFAGTKHLHHTRHRRQRATRRPTRTLVPVGLRFPQVCDKAYVMLIVLVSRLGFRNIVRTRR